MAVICAPEIEQIERLDAPSTETQTLRQRGGWSLQPQPRIGIDLDSDDELLMVENMTEVRWIIYRNYHRLGMIEDGELLVFHVPKHGLLSVRPYEDTGDAVEYLVLPLTYEVTSVQVYRRQMGKGVDVYDLHAVQQRIIRGGCYSTCHPCISHMRHEGHIVSLHSCNEETGAKP